MIDDRIILVYSVLFNLLSLDYRELGGIHNTQAAKLIATRTLSLGKGKLFPRFVG